MAVKGKPSKTKRREADRHIDVVLKSLETLDLFDTMPELNLKQVADLTNMTTNRALRILGTLESKGYVIKIQETRTYRLGYRALALGRAFENHNNLTFITRPVLKKLVNFCGESASLFVVSGGMRMVLAREEGTHDIRFAVSEGQRMPLHAGAGGKVLMAFGEKQWRENMLAKMQLNPITKMTLTSREALNREFAKVRKHGYAISLGERVLNSRAIAAPVFDHDNHLVGALGIAGPENRFKGKELRNRIELIMESARSISKKLGWKQG